MTEKGLSKIFLIGLILITAGGLCFGQTFNPFRNYVIDSRSECIITDTLSIIPGSLILQNDAGTVSEAMYSADYLKGKILISESVALPVRVSYRVYPFLFHLALYNKDSLLIGRAPDSAQNIFAGNPDRYNGESNAPKDELQRRGSISRGLTIGNNQNAVLNSTLNLQLNGKLSNDLFIAAAITDNNLPLQPDGTTTQIQEFDKVNLRVFNDRFSLLAGDFELSRASGTFLKMNRKVRGGMFSYQQAGSEKDNPVFSTRAAGAVSKGKYHRQLISQMEGNQGPYRLKGANNETFVIIIAGSERIWVDGKLLERGLDKDYTIDYNMAELTFTQQVPITKDKRIVAEFEYTEQSYARFAVFSANDWNKGGSSAWLNVFHEQDSKNQPLQQDLNNSEKKTLSLAGDNSLLAAVPGFYEDTLFRNDAVFYKMVDTLTGGVTYDSVLVYSINPDSARYRAAFAFTGAGKGNYVQVQSAANGRVYKWVAPVDGIPQGSFEPLRFLVAPASKTVVTSGTVLRLNSKTHLTVEGGLSINDKNTFSDTDDGDNAGLTFMTHLVRKITPQDSSRFQTGFSVSARYTQKRFDAADRFRAAEYERDWNLPAIYSSDETAAGADINLRYRNRFSLLTGADALYNRDGFEGLKEKLITSFRYKGFSWNFSGSNLNTRELSRETGFLRGNTGISQEAGPVIFGGEAAAEDNRWKRPESDSLIAGSAKFIQYSPFIMLADTSNYPLKAGVIFRDDYLPDSGLFYMASRSRDWFVAGGIQKNKNNIVNLRLTYREIAGNDTSPLQSYLTARAEQMFRSEKQFLTLQTFYETGSGMELKKEFAYVEVSPGQGVFQWTDYNQNGIKELDEFDVAAFSDQAAYIRIYTPGTEYVKVFTNRISQNIGLYPDRIWSQKKGFLKAVSKFSNLLGYSYDNKTSSEEWAEKTNPYSNGQNDSMLVSFNRNIRNVLSFNRTHQVFGIDYQIQSLNSRQLLLNGFDTRNVTLHSIKTRINFKRFYSFLTDMSYGYRDYSSEYYAARNYRIFIRQAGTTFSYQPSPTARVSLIPRYSLKQNLSGNEKAEISELSLEFQKSIENGGNLLAKVTANEMKYNGSPLSPVTYEMLEGLAAGNNFLWTIQVMKNLNKSLQLSLNYTGRKTTDARTVHTGTVELRAFF